MKHYGLLVRLSAKSGKSNELSSFLESALPLAKKEEGTKSWYAIQIDENTFGIFDTFGSEEAREDHIKGDIAKALFSKAPELLAKEPTIEKISVLASKAA